MNALNLLAAAVLLVSTQVHAGPLPPPPTPVTPKPSLNGIAVMVGGLAVDNAKIVDGQMLDVGVTGLGGVCNYFLTITNMDTNQDWPMPKTSKFPSEDHYSINMGSAEYGHGNFRVKAGPKANDPRPGIQCAGEFRTFFTKSRLKVMAPADTPRLVEVLLQAGKKMGGVNRYRADEQLGFNVVGSVENSAPQDTAKRCGWTARLVDKNGASTNLATGSTFGHWQNASLTNFATGTYTLIVSTTSADDALAGSPCLGKLTKTVDIFGVPGMIQGLKLESKGVEDVGSQRAILWMSPQVVGPQCMYSITRRFKGNTNTTQHVHLPEGDFKDFAGQMVGEEYLDDETIVHVSIQGAGVAGIACEGSVTKTIKVFDQPGKKGIVQ